MSKSVYSLVLMDEVVDEIDKLAYRENTNRSNMINSILAQYVSMDTPQDRIKTVFNTLEEIISRNSIYKIEPTNTNGTFLIKSAMRYKYNPVIKYCVELYKDNSKHFGCIKTGIRTQNAVLIEAMNDFFENFIKTEYEFINFASVKNIRFHSIENGRFIRQFIISTEKKVDEEEVGKAISSYVDNLDKCIKTYFKSIESGEDAYINMRYVYKDFINKQKIII